MSLRKTAPGLYNAGFGLDATAVAAGALALPLFFPGQAGLEAMLAASVISLLAGFLDFLSRSKKGQAPTPPAGQEASAPGDQGSPVIAPEGEHSPQTGKYTGKKGKDDQPPRPRPRRSDYTGQRVGVIVPGRQPEQLPKAPPAPPSEDKTAAPAEAVCPECKKPSDGPFTLCAECEANRFMTEVGNLVSSLKTREVNMLPAERYLFQARSALAVSAWKDVTRLLVQAEAAAREQEADFEESQRILSRCEEAIATAIEAGKNTLAAERAFRKATTHFKEGKYTDCMEEAVLIPALIMDRPRPRVIPAGATGASGDIARPQTGSGASDGAISAASPAIVPVPATVRCHSCGERIDRALEVCPACGKPSSSLGQPAWQEGRTCTKCGEPLEPAWRVCPACNTPLGDGPKEEDGVCRSCGREVLSSWTICPFCDAKLRDAGPAMRVMKGFSRPEKTAQTIPPALREKGVLDQIEEVDRLLDEAARRDLDIHKARNLLELAVSFTRSGNYDKGERYVRKAKNVTETLLQLE